MGPKTVQVGTARFDPEVAQASADEKTPKPSSDRGPPCTQPGAWGEAADSNPPGAGPSTQIPQSRKRNAEDEGDDSARGDRQSWRNYVEPASSNAAPSAPRVVPDAAPSIGSTKREVQEGEERQGKKVTKAGGVKRTAETEADDSERLERRGWEAGEPSSTTLTPDLPMTPRPSSDKRELAATTDGQGSPSKTPKISNVCFGIGSADKVGEATKKEQEDELKAMAEEYLKAIETGECFVHLRPKHSSNRDLRMLTQLTCHDKFRKVNFEGSEVESVTTNSNHLAEVLKKSKCTTR